MLSIIRDLVRHLYLILGEMFVQVLLFSCLVAEL